MHLSFCSDKDITMIAYTKMNVHMGYNSDLSPVKDIMMHSLSANKMLSNAGVFVTPAILRTSFLQVHSMATVLVVGADISEKYHLCDSIRRGPDGTITLVMHALITTSHL